MPQSGDAGRTVGAWRAVCDHCSRDWWDGADWDGRHLVVPLAKGGREPRPDVPTFSNALTGEIARRSAESAELSLIASEKAAQVAMLHDVMRPSWDSIVGLDLVGDYGRPVPLRDRQRVYSNRSLENTVMHDCGVTIVLGSTISVEELRVSVSPRGLMHRVDGWPTGPREHSTSLFIERAYPYKSKTLAQYHGALDRVMAQFFTELAKRIHVQSKETQNG